MTEDMMALRGLMEKSADADLLREMIGFAAQRLMELEVGGLEIGAALRREEPRAKLPAARQVPGCYLSAQHLMEV